MNIALGDLPLGEYRLLSEAEVQELYRRLQHSSNHPPVKKG
jgi:16S rRNA U516 pseudouridylate synthase RsuA-like enzyme